MRPAIELRKVPPAIYLALALHLIGPLVLTVAYALASGSVGARILATVRWRAFDMGCDGAGTILLAVGLIELGRRQRGAARGLTIAAAVLGTARIAGWTLPFVIQVLHPASEAGVAAVQLWFGRALGVTLLTSAVLLTFGSDGWRRAPYAAVVLLLLHVLSGWVPGVGGAIRVLFGYDVLVLRVFLLACAVVGSVAILLLAGALAAAGREPAPDARAAAAGLRIARTGLLIRLAIAAVVAIAGFTGGANATLQLVIVIGPAVAIATAIVFALGVERTGAARLEGMPRWLLSLGVALVLWWTTIQLGQVVDAITQLQRDDYDALARTLGLFALAGRIAATVGLALVGTALAVWARRRGDSALAATTDRLTLAFVVLTAAGIGMQSLVGHAQTLHAAATVQVGGTAAVVGGLLALAGLLRRVAAGFEAGPQLPTARIV